MALMISRLYATRAEADATAQELTAQGYGRVAVFGGEPMAQDQAAAGALREAMTQAGVPDNQAKVFAPRVAEGAALVAVAAEFGMGMAATAILNRHNPIDLGEDTPAPVEPTQPDYNDTTPFSKALGMRVLSDTRYPFETFSGYASLTKSATPFSSWLGMGMTARNATPLSDALGMKLLSGNPAPISTALGMPTRSENSAPFSKALGIQVLSQNPTPLSSALGMPLLSSQPTPLSSKLGIPVLKEPKEG